LVKNGVAPLVIATDTAKGPFAVARGRVEKLMAGRDDMDRIELRYGDGLAPLGFGEVDTVVIAGMGGELIARIITADIAKARSFAKFVLQPRTKISELRASLADAGFIIEDEATATERGRVCAIIVTRPGEGQGE
jgi:tRNA (adenine22-N1)-methyltransferase